jgi:hypothetical protein
MSSVENVRALLIQHAGVDQDAADERTLLSLKRFSVWIFAAGIQKDDHNYRPDLLEADLEDLRQQIKAVAARISQLHPWAKKAARREAERARLLATGLPEDLVTIQMTWREAPVTEWIDQKAVSALKDLGDALKEPIERLIHEGRTLRDSKGRKPDLVARKIAYRAGWALQVIGGKKPSYWKDSSKFARLCEALFLEFSLKSDTRRACEWALSELAKDGKL